VPPEASPSPEVDHRVPTASTPGRSLVTRRAVVDIVRTATLGSYGVSGFAGGGLFRGLFEWLGLGQPGIDVSFGDNATDGTRARDIEPAGDGSLGQSGAPSIDGFGTGLTIELDLTVAYGVPVAEVARQVDSAVRYAIRRALATEVGRLTIHVDGLRYQPGDLPATRPSAAPPSVRPDDLAASGTDVA
jgi:uncharacterized alkaline shock family protein YloU